MPDTNCKVSPVILVLKNWWPTHHSLVLTRRRWKFLVNPSRRLQVCVGVPVSAWPLISPAVAEGFCTLLVFQCHWPVCALFSSIIWKVFLGKEAGRVRSMRTVKYSWGWNRCQSKGSEGLHLRNGVLQLPWLTLADYSTLRVMSMMYTYTFQPY